MKTGSCLSVQVLCLVVSPGVWTYGGWDMRITGKESEQAGGCDNLYNLMLDVTCHHFCYLLLVDVGGDYTTR